MTGQPTPLRYIPEIRPYILRAWLNHCFPLIRPAIWPCKFLDHLKPHISKHIHPKPPNLVTTKRLKVSSRSHAQISGTKTSMCKSMHSTRIHGECLFLARKGQPYQLGVGFICEFLSISWVLSIWTVTMDDEG